MLGGFWLRTSANGMNVMALGHLNKEKNGVMLLSRGNY